MSCNRFVSEMEELDEISGDTKYFSDIHLDCSIEYYKERLSKNQPFYSSALKILEDEKKWRAIRNAVQQDVSDS